MTKKFNLAVVIGRFQPFHDGHLAMVQHAQTIADQVLILVGSANRPVCTRNPFTYDQRRSMIREALQPHGHDILVRPLYDDTDAEWTKNVVAAARVATGRMLAPNIAIVGHVRDATSEYLSWFPDWTFCAIDEDKPISGTGIRKVLFSDGNPDPTLQIAITTKLDALPVPAANKKFLKHFRHGPVWNEIMQDSRAEDAYREKWGDKEPHLAGDAVVFCDVPEGRHVLTVTRGERPGKGLTALPGGIYEKGETLLGTALRELYEETTLRLDIAPIGQLVNDDTQRSRRGAIISVASVFHMKADRLPMVVGQDDAASASWKPINQLTMTGMFEDHGLIIKKALALL